MNKKYSRLLLVFLIVSLCFNALFIVGYVVTRGALKKLKTPQGRIQLAAKKLKLTEVQQEALFQMQKNLQTQTSEIKQAHRDDIDAFWEEVVKDKPDAQEIEELLERVSEWRKEYIILASGHMREFFRLLTPEQRKAFCRMKRRMNRSFGNE